MEETLSAAKDPEGVGLAAPQVGKSLQLFITKPTPKSHIQTFINPHIESKNEANVSSTDTAAPRAKKQTNSTKLEGCLSLPSIWGTVKRNPSITLSYLDKKGKKHAKTFKGLFAIIIQHEIDHLSGILFPKRVFEQNNKLFKSHRNEKGEDIFEEIEL